MSDDRRFMWRALELARRGKPFVAPNPMVGCVIVKDGEIVGEGWHEAWGQPHAEVNALQRAGEKAQGATLYVTLEPCSQTWEGKKTPPCAPAVVGSGVRRVVIGTLDPNPHVSGKGAQMLQNAGMLVETGVIEMEAQELNAAYFSHVQRARPLVTAKWAMTMDGKIATRTGDARWISSEPARREVHFDRACSGAIVVGVGTVLADDPELSARGVEGRQPVRVIIDRDLRTPLECTLVRTAGESPVFVYCAESADEGRMAALEDAGLYLLPLPLAGRHLSWNDILADLDSRGVLSVILEGGGGVMASAFKERAVDRVKIYLAPKIFGGETAKSPVEGPGIPDVERAITFDQVKTRTIGQDVVVEGCVVYPADDSPSASGQWTGYGRPDESGGLKRPGVG